MEMILKNPPIELSQHIESLWSLRGQVSQQYSGLPKPYAELIVSVSGEHHWQRDLLSEKRIYKEGWLTPIQSAPRYAQTFSKLHLVGARLPIHTAALLFGPDVNLDPAIPIPLDQLLGNEATILRQQILGCIEEEQKLNCLENWIKDRLTSVPRLHLPSKIELQSLGWKADALADYYGLSARGLRKKFNSELGLGPKFWLQLNRFDSVLQSELSSMGLAAVAACYGYTDQAHMTSDFRRFAGRPPLRYLSNRDLADAPGNAPHFVPQEK